MGKERPSEVQNLVNEVFDLFAPLARREWVAWGGELLYGDLKEEMERETRVAEERRHQEEAEAQLARDQEAEAKARRQAEEDRASRIAARRAALADEGKALLAAYRAKEISKEDLKEQNEVLEAKSQKIAEDELAGGEENAKEKEEKGKRKADNIDEGENSEGEVEEEKEKKRRKFESEGVIEFEGPVSSSL
jgi:hypothetical protein